MPLLIVESASKGKTIQKYLGSQWDVAASFGHVCDLPDKDIGVDTSTFKPTYVLSERGRSIITKLKALTEKHNGDVYLATDLDREGEAIAWHLSYLLKLMTIKRVTFPEITKTAVLDGVANPKPINMQVVQGQESRRVLDRFVGYLPSPSIGSKFGSGNSAGRVQSIGLRLVVERDEAIENFVSIEHYNVFASFNYNEIDFDAEWQHPFKRNETDTDQQDHLDTNKSKYLTNKGAAEKMCLMVKSNPQFSVTSYDTEEKSESAPSPFTTIDMQQEAGKKFGWSGKKTMEVAQKLYEEGLISYHRTDSVDLSDEAIKQVRDFIAALQEAKGVTGLLPDKPNKFSGKSNAQEAHEAIRPANIMDPGAGIEDADAKALYGLIRSRIIQSQMAPAKYLATRISIQHTSTQQPFSLSGRVLKFKGWRVLSGTDESTECNNNKRLPDLSNVSSLVASDSEVRTSKTKPPVRMKETEMIKILDRKGIGRPSTMATICATNINRGYFIQDPKTMALTSTQKGREICKWLIKFFSFMQYEYSAEMEKSIDSVVSGKTSYSQFMSDVYGKVSSEVKHVNVNDSGIVTDGDGNILRKTLPVIACPTCKNNTFQQKPTRKDKTKKVWVCESPGCVQPLMFDVAGVPTPPSVKRG